MQVVHALMESPGILVACWGPHGVSMVRAPRPTLRRARRRGALDGCVALEWGRACLPPPLWAWPWPFGPVPAVVDGPRGSPRARVAP